MSTETPAQLLGGVLRALDAYRWAITFGISHAPIHVHDDGVSGNIMNEDVKGRAGNETFHAAGETSSEPVAAPGVLGPPPPEAPGGAPFQKKFSRGGAGCPALHGERRTGRSTPPTASQAPSGVGTAWAEASTSAVCGSIFILATLGGS